MADKIIERARNFLSDDNPLFFGDNQIVKLIYETADANANLLEFVFPEGGATDVPVLVIGDASIDNVDLTWFNGVTEPTIAIVNDAADAYASLDAGDDAVAGSKGLYFKSAADEDIELLNLSVTGTPRIYWDESEDQFRSTKGWVFDAACDVQGTWVATAAWTLPAFTLGADITLNGQDFDAGAGNASIISTGEGVGLKIHTSTANQYGITLEMAHDSPSPAATDVPFRLSIWAKNSTPADKKYASIEIVSDVVTAGSEESSMEFYLQGGAGADNKVMDITGPGTLSVDLAGVGTAAQVDLFDEYDDALVLRQSIQQHNREVLVDMGIAYRKESGSGYMLNIQPMIRLLAGGVYQTRQMLDELKGEMLARLDVVEQRQNRLLQGG